MRESKFHLRIALFFGALFFMHWSVAQQPSHSVKQFFESFTAISKLKCSSRGDLAARFEREGKPRESHAAANFEKMICECLPQNIRQLQSKLTPSESIVKITEAQFGEKYIKKALAVCSGESLRRTYTADTCPSDFSSKAFPVRYCACMNDAVSKLSDEEAMALGAQSADYVPLAENARRQGSPTPLMPPLVARLKVADDACSK